MQQPQNQSKSVIGKKHSFSPSPHALMRWHRGGCLALSHGTLCSIVLLLYFLLLYTHPGGGGGRLWLPGFTKGLLAKGRARMWFGWMWQKYFGPLSNCAGRCVISYCIPPSPARVWPQCNALCPSGPLREPGESCTRNTRLQRCFGFPFFFLIFIRNPSTPAGMAWVQSTRRRRETSQLPSLPTFVHPPFLPPVYSIIKWGH